VTHASFQEFSDPVDGTVWSVDIDFLSSNWTCIWDRGCKGILAEPAADLQQGCCSVGAEILDEDEGMRIAALAAMLEPELFQYVGAARDGIFADSKRAATRVVDDACIFLNRPGFSGGVGCALHLGAVDDGEDALDWKPSVCWQLPLKVDRAGDRATIRHWTRADWIGDADDMAWCCTEEPEPYSGDTRVVTSLGREIEALVGPEVMVQIRAAANALEL
jgi:hypothetical protein